jgi:hypothetical protein
VAVLALAWVAGLVPAAWLLTLATIAVLLLLDEAVYLVFLVPEQLVEMFSAPVASLRRQLSAWRSARASMPAPDGHDGQ